jgi:putative spermidine/putrescine transport system ATP-binding protein
VSSDPTILSLRDLRVEIPTPHGVVKAVDGVDLDIADGEFFSMLGPSGSGKTTVLRLIAGFERVTAGTVTLGGDNVTERAPFDRDVNTVFQDYALFPHMSVLDNVAYGLRVRGTGKADRRRQAEEALDTVQLGGYGDRSPGQLSGGQRQRVALARSIIVRPKVLLLDEPLGALDLKLREQMQVELKEIQRAVGITFLFVTDDQDEALTLSDRIAVFNEGRIEQVGSAREIYEQPANTFVAGFVGTSNLLRGEQAERATGRKGTFGIRPEKLTIVTPDTQRPDGSDAAAGTVAEVVYAGPVTRFVVDLDGGGRLIALEENGHSASHDELRRGDPVELLWHREHLIEVPEDSNSTDSSRDGSSTTQRSSQ